MLYGLIKQQCRELRGLRINHVSCIQLHYLCIVLKKTVFILICIFHIFISFTGKCKQYRSIVWHVKITQTSNLEESGNGGSSEFYFCYSAIDLTC